MSVRSGLKGIALKLARPIWRRVWVRIETQIAAATRGEGLLQRHPAAFLDAVATVAALGCKVQRLENAVAALQRQQPSQGNDGTVELSLSVSDSARVDRMLEAAHQALKGGGTLQLHLHGIGAAPADLNAASAAAVWLRAHDFVDIKIDADTMSQMTTVCARVGAQTPVAA